MTPPGAGEPAQPAAPSCAHRCRARAPTCLARGICARPRSLRQRPTSAVPTAGKVPDAASADCWPCAAHVMCAARFLGAESPYRLKCDWMLDSGAHADRSGWPPDGAKPNPDWLVLRTSSAPPTRTQPPQFLSVGQTTRRRPSELTRRRPSELARGQDPIHGAQPPASRVTHAPARGGRPNPRGGWAKQFAVRAAAP